MISVGQLLNLFRYSLPDVLAYFATEDIVYRKMVFLLFSNNIMQFAGLTFLFLALLAALRFSEKMIFLVSVMLNIAGMLLRLKVETGSYPLEQLFGLFIFTKSESYFPFLYWFIYPAYGILFETVLKKIIDKKNFYLRLLVSLGILTAAYHYVYCPLCGAAGLGIA